MKTLYVLNDCAPYEHNYYFVVSDLTEFQIRLVLARMDWKLWVVVCSAPRDSVTWNGGSEAPCELEDVFGPVFRGYVSDVRARLRRIIEEVRLDTRKPTI